MKNLKTLILLLSLVSSAPAMACQCGSIGLGNLDTVETVLNTLVYNRISNKHHTRIDFDKDVKEVKAYPTAWERKHRSEFEGSSCGYTGPQGESLYNCSLSTKTDYEVSVTQQNCKIEIQIKADAYSLKAKITGSTCKLVDL